MLQSLLPTCLMILQRKHRVLLQGIGLRMLLTVLITELQELKVLQYRYWKNIFFSFGWCQYVLTNKNKIFWYIRIKDSRQKHYWIWFDISFGFVFQSTERLQDTLENSNDTLHASNTITKGDLKLPDSDQDHRTINIRFFVFLRQSRELKTDPIT